LPHAHHDRPAKSELRRSFLDAAVLAPGYAKATLEAGFTTIRDLGAPQFVDVALRNALDRGDVPGPRIQAATMPISATGGHGDLNGLSFVEIHGLSGIVTASTDRVKVRFN
jgi:imidazolonepropionase-like amidohydrolase